MKVALAQPVLHIGNFSRNVDRMREHIAAAKKEGADLVVFCELSVCAYPPEDLLCYEHFTEACLHAVNKIAEDCEGIAVLAGGVSKNNGNGPPLFNSAFFLQNGQVEKVIHKTLLPWYDVFNEYRYFAPAPEGQDPVIEVAGKRCIVTLCEDLWDVEYPASYATDMNARLQQFPADVLINLAASPFSASQPEIRERILTRTADLLQMPVIYVNQAATHTDLIFDGASAVVRPDIGTVCSLKRFEADFTVWEEAAEAQHTTLPGRTELIHDALIFGIKEFFNKNGFSKALLGLSGGVDSALVYYLAVRALGRDNVTPVALPSRYTSQESLDYAGTLTDNLGGKMLSLSIDEVFGAFLQELDPQLKKGEAGITEENIQARARGVMLMALSNKWGSVLLNTSNKSEIAVGYGTLYGDLCGALSVIGDLYKKDVYDICRYANREGEVIPEVIIERPPTAELRPDQKDTDSLPPYDTLDKILHSYIELGNSAEAIIEQGFDRDTVFDILKRVDKSEFKRHQTPPVLRVSRKAFGRGRLIPIVASV